MRKVSLAIGLITLIMGFFLINFVSSETSNQAAKAYFDKGVEIYNKALQDEQREKLLRAAIRHFLRFTRRYPSEDKLRAVSQLYVADSYRLLGNYSTAIEHYKMVTEEFRAYPEYGLEAQVALIKIYLKDLGNLDNVVKESAELLNSFPNASQAKSQFINIAREIEEENPMLARKLYVMFIKKCEPEMSLYTSALTARAEINRKIESTAFATEWWVIGPFNFEPDGNYRNAKKSLEISYPPENVIDLDKSYEGKAGKVKWQKFDGNKTNYYNNFDGYFRPDENVAAYALTYAYVPEEQEVQVRVGSDDCMKLWINDNYLWQHAGERGAAQDQNIIKTTLKKGWNKILVKNCNGWGGYGFYFRILDANGDVIEDLKYDRDYKKYK